VQKYFAADVRFGAPGAHSRGRPEWNEIARFFRAAEPFCPKSDTPGRDRNGNSGTSAFGENARFPYDDGVDH
jgi:hypothetical protein